MYFSFSTKQIFVLAIETSIKHLNVLVGVLGGVCVFSPFIFGTQTVKFTVVGVESYECRQMHGVQIHHPSWLRTDPSPPNFLQQPLCSQSLPHSQPLATAGLCSILVVSAFPRMPCTWMFWGTAFSLAIMHLRPISAVVYISLFLVVAKWSSELS